MSLSQAQNVRDDRAGSLVEQSSSSLDQEASTRDLVSLEPRHLMILRGGTDAIFGSYLTAVNNRSVVAAPFKFTLRLPPEIVDFAPQEGLAPGEVSLGDNGLVIDKRDFPPGVFPVGLGFQAEANLGRAQLTLEPATVVEDMLIFLPKGSSMSLEAQGLKRAPASAATERYDVYRFVTAPTKEQPVTIQVAGVPEGRGRFWWLGGCLAASLVLLAFTLAWRTKPKDSDDGNDDLVMSG